MKQTILAKQERPLLAYALSKLNPDVFFHPVWLRFGHLEPKLLPTTIENLTQIAQELQKDNLQVSCKLLLICAAYQNRIGKHSQALLTLRQVSALAGQSGLTAESLWASWGSCAICFQQEEYSQAAAHLEDLQTALDEQKEWVLAGFLDVIKQCLRQSASELKKGQPRGPETVSNEELIRRTFLWLQEWGSALEIPKPVGHRWRLQWLMPGFLQKVGESLRADGFPARLDIPVWQSIKSLLRLQAYRTNPEPPVELNVQQDETGPNANDENPTANPPTESQQPSNADPPKPQKRIDTVPVVVQMLGMFGMAVHNKTLKIGPSRGLSILKYLLLHPREKIPREVLMDIFWPDAGPEAARNNLNVAMYSLRHVLRSVIDQNMVFYEDGAYGLASNLEVWLDVEEFDHCIKEGQRQETHHQLTAAVAEYEIAVNLYRGDLLAETPYEEWIVLERERLRIAYLDMLDRVSQIYFRQERYTACISACQLILTRDMCREDAHCRLMQCYSRLGQTPLALRQYQICVDSLRAELDVDPAYETTKLYENIRRREYI